MSRTVIEQMLLFRDTVFGNATTARHGLLPKLAGGTTSFFRADGTWAVPPAGVGGGGGGIPIDGWVDDSAQTWTYASGSGGGTATFTVPTDLTAVYTKGTRIKLTQTTVKYFVVIGASFAAGVTTVTITAGSDYTLANAVISANFYSYLANPQGYPGYFNFASAVTGGTAATRNNALFAVVGNSCTIQIDISLTSNAGTFGITAPVASAHAFATGFASVVNNGGNLADAGMFWFNAASTALDFYRDAGFTTWTNSGVKSMEGVITYAF